MRQIANLERFPFLTDAILQSAKTASVRCFRLAVEGIDNGS